MDRRERGGRVFTGAEALLCAVIVAAALSALVALATGALAI